MSSFFRNIKLEGDKIIWIIVFALCSLSFLVVYSVAGWNFFFKHLIKVSIGLICMYIVHKWKFKYFSRIGFFGFWISIGLLILVFLFGVNDDLSSINPRIKKKLLKNNNEINKDKLKFKSL